jgi:hypothetical protein
MYSGPVRTQIIRARQHVAKTQIQNQNKNRQEVSEMEHATGRADKYDVSITGSLYEHHANDCFCFIIP